MSSAFLIYILIGILAALAAAIPFGAALRRQRRRHELRRHEVELQARLAWIAELDAEREARKAKPDDEPPTKTPYLRDFARQ